MKIKKGQCQVIKTWILYDLNKTQQCDRGGNDNGLPPFLRDHRTSSYAASNWVTLFFRTVFGTKPASGDGDKSYTHCVCVGRDDASPSPFITQPPKLTEMHKVCICSCTWCIGLSGRQPQSRRHRRQSESNCSSKMMVLGAPCQVFVPTQGLSLSIKGTWMMHSKRHQCTMYHILLQTWRCLHVTIDECVTIKHPPSSGSEEQRSIGEHVAIKWQEKCDTHAC